MSGGLKEYTVEVLHKGEPVWLIDLKDFDEEHALRRAKSAAFMHALRGGQEFRMDDITTNLYEEGRCEQSTT